jgi:hypothetical protein
MFLSAFLCFVMYSILCLYLFGYLNYDEGRLRFDRHARLGIAPGSKDAAFSHMIAKQMVM